MFKTVQKDLFLDTIRLTCPQYLYHLLSQSRQHNSLRSRQSVIKCTVRWYLVVSLSPAFYQYSGFRLQVRVVFWPMKQPPFLIFTLILTLDSFSGGRSCGGRLSLMEKRVGLHIFLLLRWYRKYIRIYWHMIRK